MWTSRSRNEEKPLLIPVIKAYQNMISLITVLKYGVNTSWLFHRRILGSPLPSLNCMKNTQWCGNASYSNIAFLPIFLVSPTPPPLLIFLRRHWFDRFLAQLWICFVSPGWNNHNYIHSYAFFCFPFPAVWCALGNNTLNCILWVLVLFLKL